MQIRAHTKCSNARQTGQSSNPMVRGSKLDREEHGERLFGALCVNDAQYDKAENVQTCRHGAQQCQANRATQAALHASTLQNNKL